MSQTGGNLDFPVELPPRVITKFTLRTVDFQLFQFITVSVTLLDSNDVALDNRIYTISGEEYSNWGNDDNYLVNLIKSKIESGSL